MKLKKPKVENVVVEKEIYVKRDSFTINEKELDALRLSKQELLLLQLMAEGLSNQEIASRLYVSLNTVKTHTSKVFEKMNVKRRMQAIGYAKRAIGRKI